MILLRHVLEKIGALFADITELEIPLQEDDGQLGYIAGVINRDRIVSFERMAWRASRGNVLTRTADIDEAFEDPQTVNKPNKSKPISLQQLPFLRAKKH